eukprot:s2474_g6.t1
MQVHLASCNRRRILVLVSSRDRFICSCLGVDANFGMTRQGRRGIPYRSRASWQGSEHQTRACIAASPRDAPSRKRQRQGPVFFNTLSTSSLVGPHGPPADAEVFMALPELLLSERQASLLDDLATAVGGSGPSQLQAVASKDAEASEVTAFEAFHGHWHSVRLRQRTQEGSRRRGRWRWTLRCERIRERQQKHRQRSSASLFRIYRVREICDSACGELDAVLDQLTELDRQRCDILRKTTALHEQCEQMVQDAGVLVLWTNVAIFAPVETVMEDVSGSDWLVCKGANLPPLHNSCAQTVRSDTCLLSDMWLTTGLVVAWTVLCIGLLAWNYQTRIYLSIVKEATRPNIMQIQGTRVVPKHVICAAIEHTIPERGVKVSAGGLGKVLDQMLREHPEGTLSLVHPMFGDVDYGPLEETKLPSPQNIEFLEPCTQRQSQEFDTLACVVDGKPQSIKVYTMQSEENGITRAWYILDHEYFKEKVKTQPTLRYFSLWNQATALLIKRLKPDIYHCMDYHAALAPLYLEANEQIPIILVLHNADYMGVIETDFISDRFWKTVTSSFFIWLNPVCMDQFAVQDCRVPDGKSRTEELDLQPPGLDTETILNLGVEFEGEQVSMFEGRFNMLKAGVTYIKQTQAGYGICAVSENYAVELKRERTLFDGLPYLISLDNATDPAKDADKVTIEKGVDHIAMLTPAFLRSNPQVQVILAGPPDDACGRYAGTLLEQLGDEFAGRLFVCTKFFRRANFFTMGCGASAESKPDVKAEPTAQETKAETPNVVVTPAQETSGEAKPAAEEPKTEENAAPEAAKKEEDAKTVEGAAAPTAEAAPAAEAAAPAEEAGPVEAINQEGSWLPALHRRSLQRRLRPRERPPRSRLQLFLFFRLQTEMPKLLLRPQPRRRLPPPSQPRLRRLRRLHSEQDRLGCMLSEELRRGAHLCFTPSCSEPFGYVDVEFGLLGVPSVGAAIGGLGKMPGVYFRQQNSDDSKSLIDSFYASVDYALNLPEPDYWEMAGKAEFPFDTWRENLLGAYSKAMSNFTAAKSERTNVLFRDESMIVAAWPVCRV